LRPAGLSRDAIELDPSTSIACVLPICSVVPARAGEVVAGSWPPAPGCGRTVSKPGSCGSTTRTRPESS